MPTLRSTLGARPGAVRAVARRRRRRRPASARLEKREEKKRKQRDNKCESKCHTHVTEALQLRICIEEAPVVGALTAAQAWVKGARREVCLDGFDQVRNAALLNQEARLLQAHLYI